MRIAQIAPLYESVPPKLYGGTERVVSYLTEELVRQGHDVTLFASGDSVTKANLVAQCPKALRLDEAARDHIAYHVLLSEHVFQRSKEFDIIHSHIDYFPYALARRCERPFLTTLHGRLDLPELGPMYREFKEIPVVSISNSQRDPLPWVNWQATVHHGLPADLHNFRPEKGKYLAFLGRLSSEKRPDVAIDVAIQVGMPLKIAAKADKQDMDYYENVLKPLLQHPLVEYLGEIGEHEKGEFLGNAAALLFPIAWPEPFGMVMIEAMACGTPVVAYGHGSVPEIITQGETGFICHDREAFVAAAQQAGSLDRAKCRAGFEERFTAERMAREYVEIYNRMIEKKDSYAQVA